MTGATATPASATRPFALLAVSVCAFPALLAAGAIAILGGALAGRAPLWNEPALTLSEAAALKDRGTMQRLIWSGVDPNAPASVRPNILKSHDIVVTPLEASVGTRTPTAMQFLLARGARMDSRERAIVTCLAIEDDAQEILDFLDKSGGGGKPDCGHVTTPW